MNTFSTAEIARILDVQPAWIRAQARRALIAPTRNSRGHYRFSFQDMVFLRTARGLRSDGLSPIRLSHALDALSGGLPPGKSLSSLQLRSVGRDIVATDSDVAWDVSSGQTIFVFDRRDPDERVATLDRERRHEDEREPEDASHWFSIGLATEKSGDIAGAEAAYRRACRLDPDNINARINLGRLRHAADALEEAEVLYREALGVIPEHPIALFNLGVVLEDRGMIGESISCYERSIAADPEIAEAHYNLARLYARHREESAAVRHYSRYKALMRDKNR